MTPCPFSGECVRLSEGSLDTNTNEPQKVGTLPMSRVQEYIQKCSKSGLEIELRKLDRFYLKEDGVQYGPCGGPLPVGWIKNNTLFLANIMEEKYTKPHETMRTAYSSLEQK